MNKILEYTVFLAVAVLCIASVSIFAFKAGQMGKDLSEDNCICKLCSEEPVERIELYYDLETNETLYHEEGVYDEGWEVLNETQT